ncbi:1-phosphofructokinase [Demequina muriae]|uniref:1-phosphofructokinase n=1 Tax=Demequina muriae TaxID=3051664 RepID=A0ABT8GER7_9MICO|nr:1-phosphofructokinase [Demequina sp. EGI L300058]MDN4479928.1 1-phosphofructokinase [Demequina sp. EGI L300058]
MIVTLTPNPSLDRTIALEQLRPGGVHRALSLREDPGGKGVNVSRALAANGAATIAVVPAGGEIAPRFSALLDDAHVTHDLVNLPGAVRTNITLVEDDGTTTKVNELGRDSTAADAALMLDAAESHLEGASWVVGCGSLPPGLGGEVYVELIARARRRGVAVAIDTSGVALTAVIGAGPDLIKPNHHELAEHAGRPLPLLTDVVEAAREIVDAGVATVVVSLGAQGAVAVSRDGAAHAVAHVASPLSTVGAGDCLLAGWLHAVSEGATARDAIERAVRWGSAAVALPGSAVPGPRDLEAVSVTSHPALDPRLAMSGD